MKTIICGTSGAGKTTLANQLLTSSHFKRLAISHTTRPPRKGEVDGKDYRFVDKAFFEANPDIFVETASHVGEDGASHMYGLTKEELRSSDIMILNASGIRKIKAMAPEHMFLLIYMTLDDSIAESRLSSRDEPVNKLFEVLGWKRRIAAEAKELEELFTGKDPIPYTNRISNYGDKSSILTFEGVLQNMITHSKKGVIIARVMRNKLTELFNIVHKFD